jgi:hypothetical protein
MQEGINVLKLLYKYNKRPLYVLREGLKEDYL